MRIATTLERHKRNRVETGFTVSEKEKIIIYSVRRSPFRVARRRCRFHGLLAGFLVNQPKEEEEMSHSSAHRLWTTGKVVLVAAIIGLFAIPGEAIDLSGSSGKYTLNLDITVSWGARYRVQEQDTAIISPFEGGTAWSVNGDDGNLNFKKGSIVSNTPKATVDFAFGWDVGSNSSIGFFTRASAFYDFALEQNCCERTELTDEALGWAGSRTELLDAYLWWQFPIGQIRVGQQVLNWGESTFIQGGLSVINPVDVSALRVPGADSSRGIGSRAGGLNSTGPV